jgi:hypothetical protein
VHTRWCDISLPADTFPAQARAYHMNLHAKVRYLSGVPLWQSAKNFCLMKLMTYGAIFEIEFIKDKNQLVSTELLCLAYRK